MKKTYHGWIVVERGDSKYADTISVEYHNERGIKVHTQMELHGERGAVAAVEWWDHKVGQPVKLEATLRGCYRVYTETEALVK